MMITLVSAGDCQPVKRPRAYLSRGLGRMRQLVTVAVGKVQLGRVVAPSTWSGWTAFPDGSVRTYGLDRDQADRDGWVSRSGGSQAYTQARASQLVSRMGISQIWMTSVRDANLWTGQAKANLSAVRPA